MTMSFTSIEDNPSPVSRSRRRLILGAVGSSMFMSTLGSSSITAALPVLVQKLNIGFMWGQWVVIAYQLTVTALLMTMGRLGDLRGKKSVFLLGQLLFTLGSMLCGLARSIGFLIGSRVLHGLGASMVDALDLAILTEIWPARERGKVLGIATAISTFGVVAGPVLGGLLLENLDWPWLFYINIPIGIGGFLICLRSLPSLQPEHRTGRIDLPGMVWTGLGLTALSLLLTLGQEQVLPLPGMVLLGLSVPVCLGLFLHRESTCAHPMVDLAMFRIRSFRRGLVLQAALFLTLAGAAFVLPIYLLNVLGFAPTLMGLTIAVLPLSMTVVAPVAGLLSDRIGALRLILVGLAGTAVGYFVVSTLDLDTLPGDNMLRLLPIGIGATLCGTANVRNLMSAAARTQLGVASSVINMTRTMSALLGDLFLIYAGLTLVVLIYTWMGRDAHRSEEEIQPE